MGSAQAARAAAPAAPGSPRAARGPQSTAEPCPSPSGIAKVGAGPRTRIPDTLLGHIALPTPVPIPFFVVFAFLDPMHRSLLSPRPLTYPLPDPYSLACIPRLLAYLSFPHPSLSDALSAPLPAVSLTRTPRKGLEAKQALIAEVSLARPGPLSLSPLPLLAVPPAPRARPGPGNSSPAAAALCGHLQVHLRLLRGQHEEQQAEGCAERLEAQQVGRGMVRGGRCQGMSSGADILLLLLLLGRIFFGKNKVMMVALGREPSSEYKENLHKVPAGGSSGCPKASPGVFLILESPFCGVLTESIHALPRRVCREWSCAG